MHNVSYLVLEIVFSTQNKDNEWMNERPTTRIMIAEVLIIVPWSKWKPIFDGA